MWNITLMAQTIHTESVLQHINWKQMHKLRCDQLLALNNNSVMADTTEKGKRYKLYRWGSDHRANDQPHGSDCINQSTNGLNPSKQRRTFYPELHTRENLFKINLTCQPLHATTHGLCVLKLNSFLLKVQQMCLVTSSHFSICGMFWLAAQSSFQWCRAKRKSIESMNKARDKKPNVELYESWDFKKKSTRPRL